MLYGGAEYGGKTRWLIETALDLLLDYPSIEGILCRYDYNDLMTPTQAHDVFWQCLPEALRPYVQTWRSAPAWVRLPNKSRLTFVGLHDYIPSAQFGFACIDQAEEVPEETLRLLRGRIRQRLPDGTLAPNRMYLTCNPHPGIEWFLEMARLYPPGSATPGREEEEDEFAFIPALATDNPYRPPGFLEQRRRAYTDDQYRRLIEGSWDVFVGQALTEFDRNVHVVPLFDTWRRADVRRRQGRP